MTIYQEDNDIMNRFWEEHDTHNKSKQNKIEGELWQLLPRLLLLQKPALPVKFVFIQ